jgi:hypothetical protein
MKAHPWLLLWRILTDAVSAAVKVDKPYRGWIWRLARSEEVNTFVPI